MIINNRDKNPKYGNLIYKANFNNLSYIGFIVLNNKKICNAININCITYNNKIYWEFGSPSLGNRHMLIQGKSGQGKTYFIQRMLRELSLQGIPSIIIDYTDGFKKSKLEDEFKDVLKKSSSVIEARSLRNLANIRS